MTISEEYIDIGVSGSKERRPQLDRLMRDARLRKFDAIIVGRFERFARSTKLLVTALEEFGRIEFISLNASIDTSTPMGKMVFHVLAAVAELERDIIREDPRRIESRQGSREAARPAAVDRGQRRGLPASTLSIKACESSRSFAGWPGGTVATIVNASKNPLPMAAEVCGG